MNMYSLVLFIHVVGALGFFITLGLEWTSLHQIRHAATSEQVHAWINISYRIRRLGMISMLTIVIAGVYLMVSAWGGVAWIIVTLGAMLLMIVLINIFTRPRTIAIGRAMTTEKGPLSTTLRSLATDPLLLISNQIRLAVALGIIFLMTVKPSLGGSLLTIGIAIVLGFAFSLPTVRQKRVQEKPAD